MREGGESIEIGKRVDRPHDRYWPAHGRNPMSMLTFPAAMAPECRFLEAAGRRGSGGGGSIPAGDGARKRPQVVGW
jgi:hypothetical protein